MASIQEMIMQLNPPNMLGNFQQGAVVGSQLQTSREANEASKAARTKQQSINDMVASGATPQQMALVDLDAAKKMQDINTGAPDYVQTNEFLKEERKGAAEAVKTFSKDAKEVKETVDKLGNLKTLALWDDTRGAPPASVRAARNSIIANIVRLNSPGIVQESELRTYTGGQATSAAFLDFLTGKGVDVSAIKANIDPSGQGFNVDAMVGLGQTLGASRANSLLNFYNDAKDRATRAKMSPKAFDTNFGDSRAYSNLSSLLEAPKVTTPTPNATQPAVKQPQAAPQVLNFDSSGNLIQ